MRRAAVMEQERERERERLRVQLEQAVAVEVAALREAEAFAERRYRLEHVLRRAAQRRRQLRS